VGSKLGLLTSENANSGRVHDAQIKPKVRKSFDFNEFAFYRLCPGSMPHHANVDKEKRLRAGESTLRTIGQF